MANNVSIALALSRKAWESYREFRNRKEEQAYDALEKAAVTADGLTDAAKAKGQEIFADPSGEADKVIRQARRRLENAKSALQEGTKDFTEQAAEAQREAFEKGKKVSKSLRRRIEEASGEAAKKAQGRYDKAQKKAGKKAAKAQKKVAAATAKARGKKDRKKCCCCGKAVKVVGLLTLLGTLVGGAAAWWKSRSEPGTEPPRVEEYSRPGSSRLVYSTQTSEVPAATPEEDSESEGRHRLREDHEVVETDLPATTLEETMAEHDEVNADYEQPGLIEKEEKEEEQEK